MNSRSGLLAERLQLVRRFAGDTQQELADRIHATIYAVRTWEQGKSCPSIDAIIAICKTYQVSSDYLLGLTEDDAFLSKSKKAVLSRENQLLLKRFEMFLLKEQERSQGR